MILHIRWYHWWQWYNKTKCYTCFITLCNTKVSAFLMNWRYHNLILNWCVKMILPTDTWGYFYSVSSRDYFVNASSQWKMTLQCNVISHWLGAFTKWTQSISVYIWGWDASWFIIIWQAVCHGGIPLQMEYCRIVPHGRLFARLRYLQCSSTQ